MGSVFPEVMTPNKSGPSDESCSVRLIAVSAETRKTAVPPGIYPTKNFI
jgi:hypothetical protein